MGVRLKIQSINETRQRQRQETRYKKKGRGYTVGVLPHARRRFMMCGVTYDMRTRREAEMKEIGKERKSEK